MLSVEKKLWTWVQEHILTIAVCAATVLSVYLRWVLKDNESGDMGAFLLPWYEEIKNLGGLRSLSTQVGNYSMVYQTVIAIFTQLPVNPMYAYKLFSVVFDYLLAGAVGMTVYTLTGKDRFKTALAYILTVCFPMVCLNSAMWGQCDSIYVFFCVLSFYFFLRDKYIGCFIALGAAFAFKLQAIFLLPFFLFAYAYKRRYSILHFLLIPATMTVFNLPGLLSGRKLTDIFTIYSNQADEYKEISLNYPSFWNLLANNFSDQKTEYITPFATVTTVLVLMLIMVVLFRSGKELSGPWALKTAFMLSFTCVYFLPAMHDRYDYLPIILGLALVILEPGSAPGLIGMTALSLQTYGMFLLWINYEWVWLIPANLFCYCFYLFRFLREAAAAPAPLPASTEPKKEKA